MTYCLPKGVFDIFPTEAKLTDQWKEIHRYQHLFETLKNLSELYGFEEIQTPIFEKTELFMRGIGQETDIVSKEMYTFLDRAGRSLTLRPEGTAPVVRAFLERKLYNESYCQKLFYLGPMFRYERQQAGRYRQFTQYGAEIIGIANPEQDVETIDFLCTLFQTLGLQNLSLHINSIGNADCRKNYRAALVQFLTPFRKQLSEESQKRLDLNPLRILDSKNEQDQKILENAPSILDFLEDESEQHFEEVLKWLRIFNIPFQVNPKLVRGLDYYNKTVFEIVCGDLGAHDTLAAGGRYDSLLKELGGPELPAIGFALGVERVLQVMYTQKCPVEPRKIPHVLLVPLGEPAKEVCFELLKQLRVHSVASEMDFGHKKLKQIMKYADKKSIPYVAIIGDNELEKEIIPLKHMQTGQEEIIPVDLFISTLIDHIQHAK